MKYFQFIVTPNNFEKPIKLQLPILLATYPLRNEDGTMRRKTKTEYPTTLPIFRPWLDEKNLWQSKSEGDHQQPPHTDTGPAWELASWPPSAVLGNLRPNETLCCKWCDDTSLCPTRGVKTAAQNWPQCHGLLQNGHWTAAKYADCWTMLRLRWRESDLIIHLESQLHWNLWYRICNSSLCD